MKSRWTNVGPWPLVIHIHDDHLGLLETTRSNVSVDQVAARCATAIKVTSKPIIDLSQRPVTASYTATVAIAEQVRLRDTTCVFPRCAEPSAGADLDHIVAFDSGGEASTDNLARCQDNWDRRG